MPDATSPLLNEPLRTYDEAERDAISRLKARFFALMDRRRYLQSTATGGTATEIGEQIDRQNAVLSAAAAVATEIDDRLGHTWDWLAEEGDR